MKILVINGVNLNFLGIREPDIYGKLTLDELEHKIIQFSETLNKNNVSSTLNNDEKNVTPCDTNKNNVKQNASKVSVEFFQSNHEGEIVDKIQQAYFDKIDGIVINPGAHTHYSYAIHDAIKGSQIKTVEVHLSDITKREEFRKTSVIEPACTAQFKGEGVASYTKAIEFLINN